MAIIATTTWDDSVKTRFDDEYMILLGRGKVYGQAVKRKKLMGGERGSAWSWPIYEDLPDAVTALDQNADVTPVSTTDSAVTITLSEYGNAAMQTRFLRETAYTDAHAALGKLIAKNYVNSTELMVRSVVGGGTYCYTPSGVARSSLVVATYPFTWARLNDLKVQLVAGDMPPMDNGEYLTIIHPAAVAAIAQDSTMWVPLAYSNKGKTEAGDVYAGQVGTMLGFRFLTSKRGKIYYGGGGAAHATNISDTTLSAAVAAGATTCTLTSATNAAVGDYITVGTLETANTETVMVTDITSTPTLSIRGYGNVTGNTGFRFAHASGAAVVERQHVFGMHIIGKDSVGMLYSDYTGPNGRIESHEKETNIAGRFSVSSWLLYAGWGRIAEQFIWRAEFPVSAPFIGYCESLP